MANYTKFLSKILVWAPSLQELSTHWTFCFAKLTKILNESCKAPCIRFSLAILSADKILLRRSNLTRKASSCFALLRIKKSHPCSGGFLKAEEVRFELTTLVKGFLFSR